MKIIRVILILLLLFTFVPAGTNGQGLIKNTTPVKNVIIMIGDGMGFQQVKTASYVEYGVANGLYMQSDQIINTSMTTYSSSDERTDSAASATAIATGYKTENGKLSVFPNGSIIPLSILEYAQQLNKSSGLVTTTRYNHATPAAFGTHNEDRNNYEEIAKDMLTQDIDVIMGGGAIDIPSDSIISSNNYTLIRNKTALTALPTVNTTNILGSFSGFHLPYEGEMDYDTDVRLTDMVSKSLDLLSTNSDGFFLMIEGGRIDHAGHSRNIELNVQETIQFDYAVKEVMEFIDDNPETLLLIVADHETGGMVFVDEGNLDDAYPTNYDNPDDQRNRRVERVNQLNAYIPITDHTAQQVPLKAYGALSSDLLDPECEYSNANVFGLMKNAFDGTVPSTCPTYIEGYNDPSINDGPYSFATHSNDNDISDENDTNYPVMFILPVAVILLRRKYIKN